VLTHAGIAVATPALLVSALQAIWTGLSLTGTWAVYDSTVPSISLTGTTADTVTLIFVS
jgi:hypothetical protein